MFIDEIQAIVQDNISNEKFGTKELASQLGLSNSQTLRKVKAATGKSINQYIRELRLEEAANLIKTTDDTIAEISYQVGFGSPSYFNKAFSKYFKVAPGEYKTQSNDLTETDAEVIPNKTKSKGFKKPISLAIAAVLICVIGYFFINQSFSKNTSLSNSIAVLPFKDLSPEDTQWFSDGVSDNILHSLAQMKDVAVTSFTSSSTYRDTDKQIPEIAKELGVSYVLEGSVTLVEGKLKIITQLIDANDKHVWSKVYNENFSDVISVQNNVAQEVMKQLKTTLSPEEVTLLKKFPTDNMEAYNLYLEGRRINGSTKNEDLVRNMRNNEKAIALDSNFVDAYVELAATKLTVAILGYTYAFSAKEAMTYIDKALAIDPNSAKANAVKARLLLGNERANSEPYFKKAIALNPNDAETRHWYAKYFLTADKANLEEALKQSTIANKLSPFSSTIATRYTWTLILNEKYEEAQVYMKEYGFLVSANNIVIFNGIAMTRKYKNMQPIFDWVYNQLEVEPEKADYWNYWLSIGYDEFIIDKEKSVDFAKKSFDLNPQYLWYYLQRMIENGFFTEAEQFMKTDAFDSLPENTKTRMYWEYYYYKKEYKKANDLIQKNSGNFLFGYRQVSKTYAQLGYLKKIDSINKLYFVQGEEKHFNKAFVHAILKERDSMYYHLNKLKYTYNYSYGLVNGSSDFDLYRNEERFKALLREQYIPTKVE